MWTYRAAGNRSSGRASEIIRAPLPSFPCDLTVHEVRIIEYPGLEL